MMSDRYTIAGLAGANIGGMIATIAGDSAVRALIAAVFTGLANIAVTWLISWQRSRVRNAAMEKTLEDMEAEITKGLSPLIEKFGHETMARVVTRLALRAKG
jgi:hypothetical protein